MPELQIISRSDQPFRDRREAGEALGRQLLGLRGEQPVVLGIPRGGIVIAHYLALAIAGQTDIILARKLRTPGQPELAMGSVAENGEVFLNESVVRNLGISEADIEAERRARLAEIRRRSELVRNQVPRVFLAGRTVILTDDGVATGATMQVALWAARQEEPRHLIAALPVASEEALNRLARDADEVLCLRLPRYFAAVGQFYQDFPQVGDEEVLRLLMERRVSGSG